MNSLEIKKRVLKGAIERIKLSVEVCSSEKKRTE